MITRTKLSKALLLAFGGSTLMLAQADVMAQAAQRVEVTGSLIRRIDGETALPTVTLNLDTLEKAGVTNAEQVVNFITQAQGGSVSSGSVSGTNGAAAYADLRSLGSNRTLVLLNGKRIVNNPFATSAVDLNTIPLSAIERIETLPDGASATYGTDAIAGVINFITKRSFKGLSVSGGAQVTQHGGGDVYNANLLGGIGDLNSQGWNVYGGLNYREGKPMRGTEREYARSSYQPERGFNGLSPTTFPANYSQSVGGVTTVANANPSLPGCLPPSSIIASAVATNRCNADTQIFTNTIPEQWQYSGYLKGALALGSDHTASIEYFNAFNKLRTTIAPSPEGGLTMGPDSPYYPGRGITPLTNPALNTTQPISVSWRTTVLGSRSSEQENTTQRVVAGLEGAFAGFDYQVSALWANAHVENFFLNGYPMTQPLRNGVRGINGAPYLNPFGDQSAAGLEYMRVNQVLGKVQDGEATMKGVSANISRSFGSLPGGPMSVAVGAEFRQEEMAYITDIPKVSQAASSGLAGSGAVRQGDRDISAAALELNLPVLKGLEIGASVRYDKYSDFGNTTNPKVSLRYSPTKELLLRTSYNKGFSAPSLYSLYLPQSTTFTGNRYNDPVLCPNGVPGAGAVPSRDCGIQFQRLQGGNPDVKAETSKAWSLGFVLQPSPQMSFSLDYWDTYISNSISTLGDATVFGDPAKYANLFVRCSQAPADRRNAIGACQIPSGDPIAYVLSDIFSNLGDVDANGVDFQLSWNSGATTAGRFNATWRGTYINKYRFQVEPNGTWHDPVGNWNNLFGSAGTSGSPVIRLQHIVMLGWDKGPLSTLLTYRFKSGYRDQNTQGAPFTAFNNNVVGDYNIFDLSVSYTGIKGLTLTAGVLNLLDKDPPYSNQTARFQARAYDDRFHSPLGRTYQMSAKYEF
jgi:iron complex outermembrane receptor protein